jgi:threonine dehydratase
MEAVKKAEKLIVASFKYPDIQAAAEKLHGIVRHTPLEFNQVLSDRFGAEIYLKREDLQVVRSYKVRGAYNMMSELSAEDLARGVVCASAGNHAQGFAFACKLLGVTGHIFMPVITPRQKLKQVEYFGGKWVSTHLVGDNFDQCQQEAMVFCNKSNSTFIPPFDHPAIVSGQGTVGLEIMEDLPDTDIIIVPVGGGGLAAGIGHLVKTNYSGVQIIGVEPLGAPSMSAALSQGMPVSLSEIETFIDGAAVKCVGKYTFELCQKYLGQMMLVPEGKVCSTIIQLYNEQAIVAEPAGALSIAVLDQIKEKIRGKKVACVVSGGNNDLNRLADIQERSLQYEGLKHYFLVKFAQRPGALKEFVNHVLGPGDDIARFEYIRKNNKEIGPALIGIELKSREDYTILISNMQQYGFDFTELNKDDKLFGYLV